MYVCICNAITDRDIRQCTELGACSLKDLERCLGLGTNCGKCRPSAEALLQENLLPDSAAWAPAG